MISQKKPFIPLCGRVIIINCNIASKNRVASHKYLDESKISVLFCYAAFPASFLLLLLLLSWKLLYLISPPLAFS